MGHYQSEQKAASIQRTLKVLCICLRILSLGLLAKYGKMRVGSRLLYSAAQ